MRVADNLFRPGRLEVVWRGRRGAAVEPWRKIGSTDSGELLIPRAALAGLGALELKVTDPEGNETSRQLRLSMTSAATGPGGQLSAGTAGRGCGCSTGGTEDDGGVVWLMLLLVLGVSVRLRRGAKNPV